MYDLLAQFYEWEHRDFRDDLPLYLELARASSGPVLDAACGTGRVSLALAEAGHIVTGVDVSAQMLAVARSKLSRRPPAGGVRLVHADIRTMDLGERYGMALVALGSFHHLLSGPDQRRALGRLAAHLAPGGLLAIDLVNPSPEWLAAGDGTLVHQLTAPFPTPEGPEQLTKLVARTSSFETQLEHSLLFYDLSTQDGAVTRRSFRMEMRLIFRYEAELLLEMEGFRLRDIYGDYDLEPYGRSSARLILVAERE